MIKKILFSFLFIQLASCTNAQEKKTKQTLAICAEGKGCQFSAIILSPGEVDKLLGKRNFWTTAVADATLILDKCQPTKDEKRTLEEIDKSYGGSGKPVALKKIDLASYIKENGCFACPNETKKISFRVSGEGQSGSSFFYLNLKAGEAYMPNEAFQKMSAGESGKMVIDQLIRNNIMETYAVAEGQKYVTKMPLGTALSGSDAVNEQRFKKDFKKTGKTRKHLNTTTIETEYAGLDDEGKSISFWIVPSYDVCLPPGKFDAYGFYNLGYISVDAATYLVSEISGAGFQIKVTDISDGSYNFNSSGYKSY